VSLAFFLVSFFIKKFSLPQNKKHPLIAFSFLLKGFERGRGAGREKTFAKVFSLPAKNNPPQKER